MNSDDRQPLEVSEKSTLKRELAALNVNIKKQNNSLKTRNVIMRGILNGIFTALGATLGFGLLIFFLGEIMHVLGRVPLIGDVIQNTIIYEIVEEQVQDRNNN